MGDKQKKPGKPMRWTISENQTDDRAVYRARYQAHTRGRISKPSPSQSSRSPFQNAARDRSNTIIRKAADRVRSEAGPSLGSGSTRSSLRPPQPPLIPPLPLPPGRKRLQNGSVGAGSPPPPAIDRHFYSDVPLIPGGSVDRTQPQRRPGPHDALNILYKVATDKSHEGLQLRHGPGDHVRSDSKNNITASRGRNATEFPADKPNTPFENHEARIAMRKEVFSPHDALDLLYKAATNKTYEGL